MSETRARYDVTIERDTDGLPTRLCYSPSTPVYPAVTLDSHSMPVPCSLCGGAMTAQDDIDVCVCGSRRVRSQAKRAAASHDSREALAAYAHDAWAGWMRFMLSKAPMNPDGSWTMPAWAVERWSRQVGTPYRELSEQEKESDRVEADKMLALMPAAASRDDVLRGLFAEHLHILQEMADVSDAWCVAEMARLDTVLAQG